MLQRLLYMKAVGSQRQWPKQPHTRAEAKGVTKMAEILNHYGKDSAQPEKPRATDGGDMTQHKDIPYCPPVGPTSQMQQGPGIHGTNHGPSGGQQGRH